MLINQRNQWRQEFEQGKVPQLVLSNFHSPDSAIQALLDYIHHLKLGGSPKLIKSYVLEQYRALRDSESWRSSAVAEQLCEYVMFLETNKEL